MSRIRLEDIDFCDRYVSVEVFGDALDDNMVCNLRRVFEFIDKQEGGVSVFPMGKAYRKIKKVAREKYGGPFKNVISKRQITRLIKVFYVDDVRFVSIPYTADYLFKAIFYILESYRNEGVILPDGIEKFRGNIRRNVFYNEQCYSLNNICNVDSPTKIRYLNQDINSADCSLGKKF